MEMRTDVRPRRARRKGWPNWAYYALAGFLVLLTLPMYRYMLARRDAPQASPLPVLRMAEPVVMPVATQVAAPNPPPLYELASDQRCVGGAVVQVRGNEYRQIGTIQAPVHCAGRWADAPVRRSADDVQAGR